MYIDKSLARPVSPTLRLPRFQRPLFIFLAAKEIWRNRGRFFLISLVIALITTLVLFIAGLAEGLGAGNREYLEKLNADLVIYQENVDLSIAFSRIDRGKLKQLRRVEGVQAVGGIAFSNASIILPADQEPLDISLIGVEPGLPGEPPAFEGQGLQGKQDKSAIIGQNVAIRTGLKVGDKFVIKTVQGTEEEFYTLQVSGISDGRQYSIQPSIFVPYMTWDQVRPKGASDRNGNAFVFNLAAVQLMNGADLETLGQMLEYQVDKIEAVDRVTAYKSTPGYSAQQSTLDTQRIFTLLIGVLVIGGFFQIQTLQKVAQIGMLKAIGTPNRTIILAFILQIVIITAFGVALGALGTLALSLGFPPTVPIILAPQAVITAIISLLLIGPIGGLVSLRLLLKVEPLTALGLAS